MSDFANGFLGRPSLPAGVPNAARLTAADRPAGLGPEWQPSVVELQTADSYDPPEAIQAFVRVAGSDVPDEVVAFSYAPFDETRHFVVDQVDDARWGVLTAPVQIIGLGAAGILAGALAHGADRAMSVWQIDLLLNDATAVASFKVHREPDSASMARLRARLRFAPTDAPVAATTMTPTTVGAKPPQTDADVRTAVTRAAIVAVTYLDTVDGWRDDIAVWQGFRDVASAALRGLGRSSFFTELEDLPQDVRVAANPGWELIERELRRHRG